MKKKKQVKKKSKTFTRKRISLDFFARKADFFDPDLQPHIYAKIYDHKIKKYVLGRWDEDHANAIEEFFNKKGNRNKPLRFGYEKFGRSKARR